MTSPEVRVPDGVGVYFLSGHRHLPEEHSPNRDATPPEANPRSRFNKANKLKQGYFEEGVMRRIGIPLLFLFLCLFSVNYLQAQIPIPQPNVNRSIPHFPRKQGTPMVAPLLRRAKTMSLPALASKNVVPVTCWWDAQSAGASLCGYVNVPLNREHPKQGTIAIYFEQYLNSSGGPAVSANLQVNRISPYSRLLPGRYCNRITSFNPQLLNS